MYTILYKIIILYSGAYWLGMLQLIFNSPYFIYCAKPHEEYKRTDKYK